MPLSLLFAAEGEVADTAELEDASRLLDEEVKVGASSASPGPLKSRVTRFTYFVTRSGRKKIWSHHLARFLDGRDELLADVDVAI